MCEVCKAPIGKRHPSRAGRYCSLACYYVAGPRGDRVAKPKGQRMKRVKHPLSPPSGVVALCRIVLYEKIGPGEHPCHWCGKSITWMPGGGLHQDALIADHLDWDHSNDTPENLVPSCNVCNSHRTHNGKKHLIVAGELSLPTKTGSTRAAERFCVTCGTQFLAKLSEIRVGKGLYCSRSCARRAPRVQHRHH